MHHDTLCELISREPGFGIAARIRCIGNEKDYGEQAARFRNFRPVKPLKKGERRGRPLFNKQWPGNTWGPDCELWSRGPTIFGQLREPVRWT